MNLNDPQGRFEDFPSQYGHAPTSSFQDVLQLLDEKAKNNTQKGRMFEQLVKAFLQEDRTQSARFDRVWFWCEWPGNGGRPDLGIDLVARERDGGNLVAIQCKFYSLSSTLQRSEVDKFITEYARSEFSSGIFVSTASRWTKNAEEALVNRDKPIVRWGLEVFEESSIDWQQFSLTSAKALRRRVKEVRSQESEEERHSYDNPPDQAWAQSGGMLIVEGSLFEFAGDEPTT